MLVKQLISPSGSTINGPLLLTPQAFGDERGWFIESWNQRHFDEAVGEAVVFSQDNHSLSSQGVLRGLHYQLAPTTQAKLVRASRGTIFDVAVDIRRSSGTFGQWVSAELSAENKSQLWIPEGFAHGFLTTTEVAEVAYKTTDYYAPEHERCISWNDPTIGVDWGKGSGEPVLSEKDSRGAPLGDAELFS